MDVVAFAALHRYYIWANRLRDFMDKALAARRTQSPPDFPDWLANDVGLFMSHWYAALYVVIEGYRELGFHDPKIDALLASPNVELLRRYRNGVDHFQKDYFDARFVEFMTPGDTPRWIRDLNREFGRFCLETSQREPGAAASGA
jgi:hypothetical protein